MQSCKAYLSNLEIRTRQQTSIGDIDYETALMQVSSWGTDKFIAFGENAKLKS